VGCLILSLLGLPLGLQAGPGRKAVGIPFGLGFFVLYYIVFTLFRVMAEDMVLPLLAGMWLPNIIFAIMTGIIFWRVEQERPIFSERLTLWLESVIDVIFLAPLKRLAKLFRQLLSKRHGAGARSKKKKEELPGWAGMLVHADAKERVFHLPDCEQYHCKSCTLEFNSTSVAYEAGFAPCPYCETQVEKYNS
jgi:lipopolysaccharide export system permease protein